MQYVVMKTMLMKGLHSLPADGMLRDENIRFFSKDREMYRR